MMEGGTTRPGEGLRRESQLPCGEEHGGRVLPPPFAFLGLLLTTAVSGILLILYQIMSPLFISSPHGFALISSKSHDLKLVHKPLPGHGSNLPSCWSPHSASASLVSPFAKP